MRLIYALRFLTILPIPWREGENLSKVAGSVTCFPVVGWLLGVGIFGTAALGLLVWSPLATSVCVAVIWVLFTGGLHLDGLSDLADGIGGGREVDRRLEIMRDSRIGTFGALALILLLALKISMVYELLSKSGAVNAGLSHLTGLAADEGLLSSLRHTLLSGSLSEHWTLSMSLPAAAWLILAPTIGRFIMVLLITAYPSARPEGLGSFFKERIAGGEVVVTTVLTLGICAVTGGVLGILAAAGACLFALLAAVPVSRALGGLTGDAYGGICEVTEVVLLIAGTLLIRP